MHVNVRFLENLRLEATFDDHRIIADQPIRYKGDGTAPSPFDYFLASSALCAAYFVKVYCVARDIPTEDIRVTQNNTVDPDNRYQQVFNIEIELPGSISEHDREGILKAMDRCTVKRVIQNDLGFKISPKEVLGTDQTLFEDFLNGEQKTYIIGKDAPLEDTISKMSGLLSALGIKIEIASWRNPVPNVWSVHIRDADSPMCFTNGKGATKASALCSALGEYLERISTNYFYSDFYLGEEISKSSFVHYPNEVWFPLPKDDSLPEGLMDERFLSVYDADGELKASHLVDTNSGDSKRGICALPYVRQSDKKEVFVPVNLIANIFVSNGMSAGNSLAEARVQALSEIFERAVKNQIILEEITLPDVPRATLEKYPKILEGITKLEEQGFPVFVKDASLGGRYPVMNVTMMNPRNGGVFASFGAHPNFEVALERTLTELLQGRSFEGMNDLVPPTFNEFAVKEHNNIIDHFIDSTGVVSWKFFSNKPDYEFVEWNFSGTTQQEFDYLMGILKELELEVYIADYDSLGAKATRILVPGYSEIYRPEELLLDNHNKSLVFRSDILNLHQLNEDQLDGLLNKFIESEIDPYTNIGELIGVAFDETSNWGQLTILELKCFIGLAIGNLEVAKESAELLNSFSNALPERKKLFQALNVVLDIFTQELDIGDYQDSLTRMYGSSLISSLIESVNGELRFMGLENLEGSVLNVQKHRKLIESYQKLQRAKTR